MELFLATREKNKEKVREILRQDIDVNDGNSSNYNWTSLHYACYKGYIEIVKLLMQDQRIDVNKQNEYGWTPFCVACANGQTEVVKYMTQDERVDVNKQSKYGYTPFYIACENGHTEVVKHMMQDERVDANQPDNDNTTPIWTACNYNDTRVVQAILQSGRYINLDAKEKYENKTALELARQKGHQKIVNLFTEYISNFLKSQFQAGKLEIIQQSLKAHITILLSLFSTYHNLTSIK